MNELENIPLSSQGQILASVLKDINRKKSKEISTHTKAAILNNNGGVDGLVTNAEQIIGNKYSEFIRFNIEFAGSNLLYRRHLEW